MAKGFLKFLMLRTISEGEATGYQLIKRVYEITGSKPSTGSVYPLLKSMEGEGWIVGRGTDGKTFYAITPAGRDELDELEVHKMDHLVRIHQDISLANVTFADTGHLMLMAHMEVLSVVEPVLVEAGRLLEAGVDAERIGEVIEIAAEMLGRLTEDDDDE